jgi:hypothetical protein
MFSLKPEYETSYQRIEAFWHNDVLDRPVTMFQLYKPPEEQQPLPQSSHRTSVERWLDVEFQTAWAAVNLHNQLFLGDTLPIAYPNLGPEVFSAFYGCPIHFGDYGTSWTEPILKDWSQAEALNIDWNSPYLLKLEEMTTALLEAGKDTFITGMTDWHPGGDAVAAMRDPQRLAVDMIEHTEALVKLLNRLEADYFAVYDRFYEKLRRFNQPITSWTPLVFAGKYYIPSNDFSIMVSKKMFDEVFLPGIQRECQFLDRSIYHLDGPGALRHLDSLLAIPELHAIQFVQGAGNEDFTRWVAVYQKIQAAGKAIQVNCTFDEIPEIIEALQPRGLFLSIGGVPDRASAEALLKHLENWTTEWRR